jgi:hypothetical protein
LQEEIENKTFNLAVSTTKLTGRVVVGLALNYLKNRKCAWEESKSTGKQSVKQLLGQNQGVSSIDIAKTDLKDFQRVAGKYGIDYAIRKDSSEVPPRYIVFFKAKDADAMTAAFKEYSAKVLKKQQTRKSVLAELHKAVAIAASLPQKAVDHVKNLHQDLSL